MDGWRCTRADTMSEDAPERICLPPIVDGAAIESWLVPSLYSPPTDQMIPEDWSEYIRADLYDKQAELIAELERKLHFTNLWVESLEEELKMERNS